MDGFYGQPAYVESRNHPVKQHLWCTSVAVGRTTRVPQITAWKRFIRFTGAGMTQLGCNDVPRCGAAMTCNKRTGAGTSCGGRRLSQERPTDEGAFEWLVAGERLVAVRCERAAESWLTW